MLSWKEFKRSKSKKEDVKIFQKNIAKYILNLHYELSNNTYQHGHYHAFYINDPKRRHIHKASVKDRIVHHAVFRILYPIFDPTFIYDSYSCRLEKGTHKAMNRFRQLAKKVSNNNTKTCFILKLDIKKFFHSIDQGILLSILQKYIPDQNIINLLQEIITSFNSGKKGIGLPLGNLTSQLFCNIYMNEFDQFIKHTLKIKYYIRYADDFVILHQNRVYLENLISIIDTFLQENLKLQLHPDKIYIKTLSSGIDFLGWIHFFDYRILRTTTKRRMFKRINNKNKSSYIGSLKHGNSYKIRKKLSRFL